MRCLLTIFTLLAYIAFATTEENPGRSRRHLQFIKDLFITKLFGRNPTGNVQTSIDHNIEIPIGAKVENANTAPLLEDKVLEIPENNLQDEAKVEMIETYLGTTNHEETLETLKNMKSLLETGILNAPTYTFAHNGYDDEILQPPYPASSSFVGIRKPLAPPMQFEHSVYGPPHGSPDFPNKNIDQIPEASTITKLDPRRDEVIIHSPITPVVVDFTKFPTSPSRASDRFFAPEPYSTPVYHHYHHYKPSYPSHSSHIFKPAPPPLSHFKSNKFQMFSIPFAIFTPIQNFPPPSGIMIQKTVPYETTIGHQSMPLNQYPFKPDTFGMFGLNNNNYGFNAPTTFTKPGFYFDIVDEADYLKNNVGYARHIPNQAPIYTAPPTTEKPFTGYHYGPSATSAVNANKQQPDNNSGYVYLAPHYVCKTSLELCKPITGNSAPIPDRSPSVVSRNKVNSNEKDTSIVEISQSIPSAITQEPSTELPPTKPVILTVTPPTDGTSDIKVEKMNDPVDSDEETKIIINEKPTETASTTEEKPTEVPSTITPVETTTISIFIGKPPDKDTRGDIPGSLAK